MKTIRHESAAAMVEGEAFELRRNKVRRGHVANCEGCVGKAENPKVTAKMWKERAEYAKELLFAELYSLQKLTPMQVMKRIDDLDAIVQAAKAIIKKGKKR